MYNTHRPTNFIGQSQSGTGKTAAFVLTMLSRINPDLQSTQAICIAPSRELARQIMSVVALMGMLIHNNSTSPQELTFARCLLELSLASNAPTTLKTHALRLLPARLAIPLPQLALTPYVPVPGTNGEEWDRLEPASALDALVEMVLAGEYGGVDGDAGPGSSARRKDKLELRAAAAGVFEVRYSR